MNRAHFHRLWYCQPPTKNMIPKLYRHTHVSTDNMAYISLRRAGNDPFVSPIRPQITPTYHCVSVTHSRTHLQTQSHASDGGHSFGCVCSTFASLTHNINTEHNMRIVDSVYVRVVFFVLVQRIILYCIYDIVESRLG